MKKKIVKYGLRLGILAIIVLLFLKWINISDAIGHLGSLSIEYFLFAIFIILVANLVKGVRFYILTEALGLKLSFLRVMLVNSMCIIVGRVTPGRVGEGVKIMLLDRKKSDLTFCFVLEKIADALLVLMIAIVGIGVLVKEGTILTFVNSYLIFALIIICLVVILMKIDKVINFIAKRDVLEDKWFLRSIKKVNIVQWTGFFLITFLIRILALALAILIILALGIDASWILVIVIWNLAIIVGQVSALPGGFGAREAGYTGLLVGYVGITKELAGIAALLVTAVDLIVESFLGITCWILLKLFKKSLDHKDGHHIN